MSREIILPIWLSVLSLSVALFVPLGVSLIADTSSDAGNRASIAKPDGFVSPEAGVSEPVRSVGYRTRTGKAVSVEEPEIDHLDHRV